MAPVAGARVMGITVNSSLEKRVTLSNASDYQANALTDY